MFQLFNLSRFSAGFVAVLVGYTSSAIIIFQAAATIGASDAQISSWFWALGIGMGASTLGLSLYYKQPVLTAWSTPGAALLMTSLAGVSMSDAIGAFLFSSVLITLCGITGWFEKIVKYVPRAIGSAMLAGVLVNFGLDVFVALQDETVLVGIMLVVFLLSQQVLSRYAVPLTLLVGMAVAYHMGLLVTESISLEFSMPIFTAPSLSLSALIGVGLPLFIVTMTSQNIPGMAVLRANGYTVSSSPLISWTGITGLALAPFGGYAFNLAAITAAICMTESADKDPSKRYLASTWTGILYLLAGLMGASIVALFSAFPKELVMAIAGLALLGTIANSLSTALSQDTEREPAILTFLVTASGMALMGIGSAFWGLIIGLIALQLRKRMGA